MENGVMMQYFEWNLPDDGQLWNRLASDAAHLARRGISAVWIPPAYKQADRNSVGYSPYDLYDFGEYDQKGSVRTKYGTRAQLEHAIKALRKEGVGVLLDVVLNHKAGGDNPERFMAVEVDADDRNREIGEPHDIESFTEFTFPGRGRRVSAYKWHWYDFSGVDYDRLTDGNGIYRILGDGKGWSQGVDKEMGNYDYLMFNDIDLDRPQVRKELRRWGRWAVETFGFTGFRMDAVKHMDYNFTRDFIASMRRKFGPSFYAVAEYWTGDVGTLEEFIDHTRGMIDLFDAPLHYRFDEASSQGEEFDMATLLDGSLVATDPTHAVTLVDNHDSQPGSALESAVDDWFKPIAYALILLMREGYPCIFYGDYYSMGGVASPHRRIIDELLDARLRYAYGDEDLYFDDHACVGLVRHGDDEHPGSGLVLLMSNAADSVKTVSLGPDRAGECWRELTGSVPDTTVTVGPDGMAQFSTPGRNFALWVKAE